ncbi:MAG: mechanosensitive ion channel family protein [Acidimicrobiales bacterium]|nr:mechanosensitive ion channel family protein [Actinomycetota bacterium]
MTSAMLAQAVDPEAVRRLEACGPDPGVACRWVADATNSVGLAKVADWLTGTPLQIVLVLLGASVLNRIVRRVIRRFAQRIEGSHEPGGRLHRLRDRTPSLLLSTGEVNLRSAARAQTIALVLRSITSSVIWGFASIYVLGALGLDLGPLLATAGVAGVALGFGAQSLVRDFLSGMFLLIEDQYGVGDVVDLGEASGVVEQVTLRSTRLRDQNGTVWHVPNGQILRVGNKSQQWARAVLDVAVAPNADLEAAAAVIGRAAEAVWDLPEAKPDVLDRPEVLGLEYLGPDAATIRVQGKTRPGGQWRVSRLLRVRIAEALSEAGIDLPPSNYIRPGTSPAR